jgi:hypothetical protein
MRVVPEAVDELLDVLVDERVVDDLGLPFREFPVRRELSFEQERRDL